MKYEPKYGHELESLLHNAAKSPALLHEFLGDLLSLKEYKDLAVRWQIVKLMEQGFSNRQIIKRLKVSPVTVTRGAKEMFNKHGGFRLMLNKHYRALKLRKPKKNAR
ncbi:MAG: hypothetical protein KGJ93_00710 [Patescibacteria group bacterium]|nr:hypothetical protein [Patescibacteria group bacterium]